ncbi:hypothetical protein FGO68_gene14400 [Halteria grandinella]|uniref:Uncharacterized protein n=1 Tax=Halteria grandinella TaxID=5974 RepID=A0A8J8T6L4_HALGN|nr:hypothetical protein FGO68_gene14400 [Halteria grandinella]
MKSLLALLSATTLLVSCQESILPIFKSNRLRVAEYLPEKGSSGGLPSASSLAKKEFFIQKEVEQQFGHFNISFQVDIVLISNIEKPYYDKAYPAQSFSQEALENLDYKMNAELMQNSFRVGYYKSADKFQNLKPFPYREDNVPRRERTLEFQKDYSGNDVDIRYQINTIDFNSKLNAEFRRELATPDPDLHMHRLSESIHTDIMMHGRQYVIYLIDCSTVACTDTLKAVAVDLSAKYPEKILMKTLDSFDNKKDYIQTLISTISSLITREYEVESMPTASNMHVLEDDGIKMFQKSISPFLIFLRTEYFPRIAQFKKEAITYQFESPLNFLMMRSDLREFLSSFFQAESLLKYALKFHLNSMFTLTAFEDKQDHMKKKQEGAYLMLKSHQVFMGKCIDMLKEYHHLVEHDLTQNSCLVSQSWGCKFRIYGASIISIGGLAVIMVVYFVKKVEEVGSKANKKLS